MDFYKLSDGTLVGTKDDAKKSKQAYEPHAVPTDKQGLMDYLNRAAKPVGSPSAHDAGLSAPQLPPPPAPSGFKSAPAPLPQDRAARLIALEEAIQDSNGFELASLVGNVMSRLEELKREAKLPA